MGVGGVKVQISSIVRSGGPFTSPGSASVPSVTHGEAQRRRAMHSGPSSSLVLLSSMRPRSRYVIGGVLCGKVKRSEARVFNTNCIS